jgi:hypothetical protein
MIRPHNAEKADERRPVIAEEIYSFSHQAVEILPRP